LIKIKILFQVLRLVLLYGGAWGGFERTEADDSRISSAQLRSRIRDGPQNSRGLRKGNYRLDLAKNLA
jgi:hypothetical protein